MTTVVTGATLIDGSGAEPLRNASVVIEGERIVAAGAGIDPPRDAEMIDAAGMTLMPGMIDCHVHLTSNADSLQERMLTPYSLQIAQAFANARLSRFWPKQGYAPGRPQPSFDKQFLRDWVEATGWNKRPPPPPLPPEVIEQTRAAYQSAYDLITGPPTSAY
jgi:hypothetical protein